MITIIFYDSMILKAKIVSKLDHFYEGKKPKLSVNISLLKNLR
jgi:hypothetical protein